MRLGDYELSLPPLATLVVAAMLGFLVYLGTWQLDRAAQKEQISREFAERRMEAPSRLPLEISDPEALRYRQFRLAGHFDPTHQILLDNQVHRGVAGMNVLTPFTLAAREGIVLVDRGWVPWGADRSRLPDVSVTDEVLSLTGSAYAPYGKGFRIGDMDANDGQWPKLVQFLDFEQLSERLGYPVLPITIRMDAPEPVGYEHNWFDPQANPQRHLSYAIQWFALAAVLLVIWLALHLRRIDGARRGGEADHET